MDIIPASNTPTLLKKILGNSTFSENSSGTIENQTFTINSDTSSYVTNSKITINNSEISFTSLGLLNQPVLSENSSDNISLSIDSNILSIESSISILDKYSDLKVLYDEALSYSDKSINSPDNISKETYLLLSIQSLVDFPIIICNIFSQSNKLNILSLVNSSLLSSSNAIKLMNNLIGQSSFSYSYGSKISDELDSSLKLFENAFKLISISNEDYKSINKFINSYKGFKIEKNNSKSLFTNFCEYLSQYIIYISTFISLLLDIPKYSSDLSLINLINSFKNISEIIKFLITSVCLSYDDVNSNYDEIMHGIKLSLAIGNSITILNEDITLYSRFDNYILLTKTTTKSSNNIKEKSILVNSRNYASYNDDILEKLELIFTLYVSNLKINISGTIGSSPFTGFIFYPSTYNLSYFGIDNITVNSETFCPSTINFFNLTESICPTLKVSSITASTVYNTDTPLYFTGTINLSLSVNGEILSTIDTPIIIAK